MEVDPLEIPDEFTCKICLQVLNKPRQHSCNNFMCKGCIAQYLAFNPNAGCPLCRQPLIQSSLINIKAHVNRLQATSLQCECRQQIRLNEVNEHINFCHAYQNRVNQAFQQLQAQGAATVNRSTFNCPVCEEKNMRREALIEHFGRHKGQSAVCPICTVMEYGDPNYVSKDLAGHLKLRHKYDLDTFTQNTMDDDSVLQMVLQQSMNDNQP